MKVTILKEAGHREALIGLSLSRNQKDEFLARKKDMFKVARRLAALDGGHNKFLESIIVWLDVIAPRFWWQQMDTYRSGITKQSQSSMFGNLTEMLRPENFEGGMDQDVLDLLTTKLWGRDNVDVKRYLPESFLQERVICLNYKAIRHIYHQRKDHRLKEWHFFLDEILKDIECPDYITETKGEYKGDRD